MFLLFSLVAVLLMACSNKDSSKEEKQEEEKIEKEETEKETNKDSEAESVEEEEEVSFEVLTPPEDQGDMEVWLEGDFMIKDKVVTVKGQTNLLPDTQIRLVADPEESIIIGGGYKTATVQENGEFEIELKLPSNLKELVHLELKATLENAKDEIKEHYGDDITGVFVRMDENAEEPYKKISYKKTLFLDDSEQSFSIEPPAWTIPEDIGSPNVTIEPSIKREGEYLVVNVESNLISDAFLQGNADIPNYITTGFDGSTFTNPDGSATLYIENPEKDSRIKNLEEFEVVLKVNPTNSYQGPHVLEVYGENGEKFEGSLVKQTDDYQYIEQRIKINVD